jgi:hypothetical protein
VRSAKEEIHSRKFLASDRYFKTNWQNVTRWLKTRNASRKRIFKIPTLGRKKRYKMTTLAMHITNLRYNLGKRMTHKWNYENYPHDTHYTLYIILIWYIYRRNVM